jgi:alpha-L-fucosidase 2
LRHSSICRCAFYDCCEAEPSEQRRTWENPLNSHEHVLSFGNRSLCNTSETLKHGVKINSKTTRRGFLALSASAAALPKLKPELFAAGRPESAGGLKPPAQDVLIYFDQPALHWADALPVGNGRLGGMVFGRVKQERIALNEDTLWSGYPKDWNNPEAKKHIPMVREFVLKNKDYKAADEECRFMQGPYSQAYQPLGDLLIDFEHGPKVTGYRRKLNLDEAVTSVSNQVDGVGYGREVFVSAPAQVVVAILTCSKPGGLNGRFP